jgi:hypothetical protein
MLSGEHVVKHPLRKLVQALGAVNLRHDTVQLRPFDSRNHTPLIHDL